MKGHKFFFIVAFMIVLVLFFFAFVKPQFFAATHTMDVGNVAMAEHHNGEGNQVLVHDEMASVMTPMLKPVVGGHMIKAEAMMNVHHDELPMIHMHPDLM